MFSASRVIRQQSVHQGERPSDGTKERIVVITDGETDDGRRGLCTGPGTEKGLYSGRCNHDDQKDDDDSSSH